MAHLSIEHLRVSFGALTILDGLSLDVTKGESHALIGPNGAGKTTLINAISGWIKPQAGIIRLQSQSLIGKNVDEIARLGMIRANQIPHGFPTLKVEDHLRAALQQGRGWFKFGSKIDDDVDELANRLGLSELLNEPAQQLSHGQRKRLELACALALNPNMFLLDEPTAGLSPGESEAMVNTLKEISTTMLIVEHDMDVVAALADRVSVLHGGRLLAQGTPEEIASDNSVRKVYLGHAAS